MSTSERSSVFNAIGRQCEHLVNAFTGLGDFITTVYVISVRGRSVREFIKQPDPTTERYYR